MVGLNGCPNGVGGRVPCSGRAGCRLAPFFRSPARNLPTVLLPIIRSISSLLTAVALLMLGSGMLSTMIGVRLSGAAWTRSPSDS